MLKIHISQLSFLKYALFQEGRTKEQLTVSKTGLEMEFDWVFLDFSGIRVAQFGIKYILYKMQASSELPETI